MEGYIENDPKVTIFILNHFLIKIFIINILLISNNAASRSIPSELCPYPQRMNPGTEKYKIDFLNAQMKS